MNPKSRKDVDVIILGGGPAGLAAAIAARRFGFKTLVVDARYPPIDKACGEGLLPSSLSVAAQFGIRVPSNIGIAFRGIRYVAGERSVSADFPEGPGLGIRRTALHSFLVRCAEESGAELWWGAAASSIDGHLVRVGASGISARWIVGADGAQSRVRHWAGLDSPRVTLRRFGFRRHYRVAAPPERVEVYWGQECEGYVTPVANDEICVAVLSRDPRVRIDDALERIPELRSVLAESQPAGRDRGSPAETLKLKRVTQGHIALLGDASGTIDPIMGEGISLAIRQAAALSEAMVTGNLSRYERDHRLIERRPRLFANLVLLLDRWPRLCKRTIATLESRPELFADLVAMHAGRLRPGVLGATAARLGWSLATL